MKTSYRERGKKNDLIFSTKHFTKKDLQILNKWMYMLWFRDEVSPTDSCAEGLVPHAIVFRNGYFGKWLDYEDSDVVSGLIHWTTHIWWHYGEDMETIGCGAWLGHWKHAIKGHIFPLAPSFLSLFQLSAAMRWTAFFPHTLLPWCSAQSNGASQPWTATSETVSQNKSLLL